MDKYNLGNDRNFRLLPDNWNFRYLIPAPGNFRLRILLPPQGITSDISFENVVCVVKISIIIHRQKYYTYLIGSTLDW